VSATEWPPEVAGLPVCPKRNLPIPYIAEVAPDGTGHFTILDEDRARECLAGRLCAMCAERMGGEVALIGDQVSARPDGFFIEPPVHERCAEIAVAGLCPYLSRQRVPRRVPDGDVTILGLTAEELAEVGRTIAKRPPAIVVASSYVAAVAPAKDGGQVIIYQPKGILRVRRFAYDENGRTTEAIPRVTVRVQRRTGRKGGKR
jgi:hypothetical protein